MSSAGRISISSCFQHGLQDGYLGLKPHVKGGLFPLTAPGSYPSQHRDKVEAHRREHLEGGGHHTTDRADPYPAIPTAGTAPPPLQLQPGHRYRTTTSGQRRAAGRRCDPGVVKVRGNSGAVTSPSRRRVGFVWEASWKWSFFGSRNQM